MKRARRRALLGGAAAAAAAITLATAFGARSPAPLPERPPNERPVLLLLTSLPLMFGDDFSLRATGSPAVTSLSSRYRLVPVSTASAAELTQGRLLLMAHPLAQPPQDLVALDAWVRRGGRLLLLADPMLEWPSERPLGDPLRAPPAFVDTGLLAHWGLQLRPPDKPARAEREIAGFEVLTVSPGKLFGRCNISADRFVARCALGRGEAIVVADADLLNGPHLGPGAKHNLDAINAALASLEGA